MKKLLYLCAALLMIVLTATAHAATDVTGAWNAQFTSGDGSVTMAFDCTLRQDGNKVTGSFADPQDPTHTISISDGKVEGDTLSFTVVYNGLTIHHTGTINGDEIKLSAKADSPDLPGGTMVLKRVKPATAPVAVPAG